MTINEANKILSKLLDIKSDLDEMTLYLKINHSQGSEIATDKLMHAVESILISKHEIEKLCPTLSLK